MVDIRITTPEGSKMVDFRFNLDLFARFFLRQLRRIVLATDRLRFKALEENRIVIETVSSGQEPIFETTIEFGDDVAGSVHGFIEQVLLREAYRYLFVWESKEAERRTMGAIRSIVSAHNAVELALSVTPAPVGRDN